MRIRHILAYQYQPSHDFRNPQGWRKYYLESKFLSESTDGVVAKSSSTEYGQLSLEKCVRKLHRAMLSLSMEFSAQVSLEDMKLWKNAHSEQNRGNEKPQLQGLAQLASHKRHGGLVKVAEPATNTAETRAVKS